MVEQGVLALLSPAALGTLVSFCGGGVEGVEGIHVYMCVRTRLWKSEANSGVLTFFLETWLLTEPGRILLD